MARPGLWAGAAITAIIISGADVPNPIISGDTFKLRAVAEAPMISLSALHISSARPVMMAVMLCSMLVALMSNAADYDQGRKNIALET